MEPVTYFQVDFEGAETTSTGQLLEGYGRRRVFVEVGSAAYDGSVDTGSKDVAAEEMARSVAVELVAEELADLNGGAGLVTRLDRRPPAIREAEPDLEDRGIRAWLAELPEQ
ncbi:MAG: hypothetical protein JO170_15650 [Verrucomicrobia bacterium]|nr:hypothetical protein [Verrucomicrobiota bacterium]